MSDCQTAERIKSARPKQNDPRVIELAARGVLADFKEWAGEDTVGDDEIIADLSKAMLCDHDSYEIAKSLEREGWLVDGALVEVLGNIDLYGALTRTVKEWVELEGVTLSLAIGQEVDTQSGRGFITKLCADTATYIVTPQNEPRFAKGGGWIIDAEKAAPVEGASS